MADPFGNSETVRLFDSHVTHLGAHFHSGVHSNTHPTQKQSAAITYRGRRPKYTRRSGDCVPVHQWLEYSGHGRRRLARQQRTLLHNATETNVPPKPRPPHNPHDPHNPTPGVHSGVGSEHCRSLGKVAAVTNHSDTNDGNAFLIPTDDASHAADVYRPPILSP